MSIKLWKLVLGFYPSKFLLSIWVMPYKIRSELASLVKQLFMDRVRRRTSRKTRSRILVVRMDFLSVG